MNLNQLDIIVSNVPQVCADLERILDKKADYVDDSFAQFTIGSHCLMLSQIHFLSSTKRPDCSDLFKFCSKKIKE